VEISSSVFGVRAEGPSSSGGILSGLRGSRVYGLGLGFAVRDVWSRVGVSGLEFKVSGWGSEVQATRDLDRGLLAFRA